MPSRRPHSPCGDSASGPRRPGYTPLMKWASFVSEEPDISVATHQASQEVLEQMHGCHPDLLFVFVSPHHEEDYPVVPEEIRRFFPDSAIIGCSGGGVVGGGREVEHSPALSITAAWLPEVRVEPFHLEPADADDLGADPSAWYERVQIHGNDSAHFVLFPDPYSCDAAALLRSLDVAFPDSGKIGGLASGATRPGENALFVGDDVYPDGAVGLILDGNIDMDTIVAQGCRPVGGPLFVTAAARNRVLELDGRRPTEVMAEIFHELEPGDRDLFRRSLFVGVVMNEGRSEYGHGDFLIRNVVGVDPETGTLTVGEVLRPGQVIQFHVRDALTSAADLESALDAYKVESPGEVSGILLFSCLGRGETLYGEPDHDCRAIAGHLGPTPIGGFFCNGEIGPVDQRTFLHGYTSSIGVFRPRHTIEPDD